jgi:1-aminocyclopropane-1-carboxylate deaminase/D-cysteine desulfhydrase-like pyridoxal-dependent ACC family enzyme
MSERPDVPMTLRRTDLLERVGRLPRVPIAHLPTPLEPAPRLRNVLGTNAPNLLIKRDDLTGLAFGGNKVRHLEFRLADMRSRGADTLLVRNMAQSNHARIHTALAARFGLSTVILKIPSHKDAPVNGNLLLDHIMGATIVEASSDDPEVVDREFEELIDDLESAGHRVYNTVSDSFSEIAGTCAYLIAAVELLEQCDEQGVPVDHIFMVSGASSAGLALAGKVLGSKYRVYPVNIGDQADASALVRDLANRTAKTLGIDIRLSDDDITVHNEYAGEGYAIPSDACLEAMRLAGRTEGLILDPVYTAKAFSAVVGEVRKGAIGSDETVVFVHTGGTPITFAYGEEIMQSLTAASAPIMAMHRDQP